MKNRLLHFVFGAVIWMIMLIVILLSVDSFSNEPFHLVKGSLWTLGVPLLERESVSEVALISIWIIILYTLISVIIVRIYDRIIRKHSGMKKREPFFFRRLLLSTLLITLPLILIYYSSQLQGLLEEHFLKTQFVNSLFTDIIITSLAVPFIFLLTHYMSERKY